MFAPFTQALTDFNVREKKLKIHTFLENSVAFGACDGRLGLFSFEGFPVLLKFSLNLAGIRAMKKKEKRKLHEIALILLSKR